MTKAKEMGISAKDNWIKQPENMMRWRAVSEAARFVFPDAIMNLYTPDEIEEAPKTLDQELDEEYGNPNDGIEVGDPEYKNLYRKFRGRLNKDLTIDEIEERISYIDKKIDNNKADQKDIDELNNLSTYLDNLEKTIEV